MAALVLPSASHLYCPIVSSNRKCCLRRQREQNRTLFHNSSFSHVHTDSKVSLKLEECHKPMRLGDWRRRGVVKAEVATEEEVDNVSPGRSVRDDVAESVRLLKAAAKTRKSTESQICAAFQTLEKAKLDPSDFLSIIGGSESPGRTWMLVFNTNKDADKSSEAGGKYFPVTAVQRFDAEASTIENGVYLGPVGALTLTGKFSWETRKMAFFFHTLNLKFGNFGPFSFGIGSKDKQVTKDDPFFIWYYADDEIIVARGRGGGTAFWVRCRNVKDSLP